MKPQRTSASASSSVAGSPLYNAAPARRTAMPARSPGRRVTIARASSSASCQLRDGAAALGASPANASASISTCE
jgi:hypothetical protein